VKLHMVILGILLLLACGGSSPDDKTLFEQGQKYESEENYSRAFDSYKTLFEKYPQSPYAYKAIFLAGYIQFEHLKNPKSAIQLFEKLVEEYPACDLADDAAVIKNIAASGKDLMSIFEDSTQAK